MGGMAASLRLCFAVCVVLVSCLACGCFWLFALLIFVVVRLLVWCFAGYVCVRG